MNAESVLSRCAAAGVELRFEGGGIAFHAPRGAMTATLKGELATVKPLLVDLYEERAAIKEFCAGMDRATAERLAAAEVLGGGGRARTRV